MALNLTVLTDCSLSVELCYHVSVCVTNHISDDSAHRKLEEVQLTFYLTSKEAHDTLTVNYDEVAYLSGHSN